MSEAARLRPIEDHDWPAITTLEAHTYSGKGLAEGPETLRTRANPDTSFVLDTGGGLGGYLLALPYPDGSFPDLTRPEAGACRSGNLHLHDLVIAPGLRARGWGRLLVRHLTAIARPQRYERISLVSVGATEGFWAACGFRPHPQVALPGSYGPAAVYMSSEIG
ncbi:GNAT family N-acetyltransferase [Actinoplanes subglobosus]|uniref:GNAT family N-acetyltransferase n=1 Tax=Actinoplanes subglobosus TaxID=1547892 RepID=A0ABV8IPG7_9ACTN